MGYRSEVAIVLSDEAYELLCCMIENIEEKELLDSVLELVDEMYEEKDNVLLYYECTKWYETYPEVDFIMDFIGNAFDEDMAFNYLRVGEDYADVENKWNRTDDLDTYVGLSRAIMIE